MSLASLFNKNSLFEAFRYTLASIVALGIDTAILFILHGAFDVPVLWAAAAGFFSGIIVIYALSIKHVFQFRRIEDTPAQELFWFWFSGAVGLLLTIFSIWILTVQFQLHLLAAKILTAGVVFSLNFMFRKVFLFTNWLES
jgi:putative flippase GtrA